MSTVTSSPGDVGLDDLRREEREKLRTSKFDVVTSLMMALMVFVGVFALMLFIVWLFSGDPRPVILAPIIEPAAGRADNAEGFERDFEPPGVEEVEELLEPTLQDTLEAVTDAVSSVAASLDSMNTDAAVQSSGDGKGDSRPPGPEGEGADIVPRYERWQLNFSAKDIRSYARQLDYYKIELAAFGGTIKGLDYASNLSSNPTKRYTDKPSEDKRLYFSWKTESPLKIFDQQLLQQASVNLGGGRNLLKFIPPELENLLANIELQFAESKGHSSVREIAKTIFESRSNGDGYAFEVVDQRYRTVR